MPRLTKRNGDGDGDLIACFSCNYEARPVEDCGVCPHFTEALHRLYQLEELAEAQKRVMQKEEKEDPMTEERRKELLAIADSLELCSDHETTCKGCMLYHVLKENAEDAEHCGAILTRRAALAIRELAKGGCCEKCNNQEADGGPGRGEVWQMNLYERAIGRWGDKAQVLKAIEELGELAVELSRWLNSYDPADGHLLSHIREELADVCIMSDQLQLIFGDVSEWEMQKLERLERRLEHGL